jgi:hypothetical protein
MFERGILRRTQDSPRPATKFSTGLVGTLWKTLRKTS